MAPPLPTALVNATSANANIVQLNAIATNFPASSVALVGTSALTLFNFGSNLINSSGSLAASAVLYGNLMMNFVATSALNFSTSTSALVAANQILQASSAMTSMMLQLQSGYQVSS